MTGSQFQEGRKLPLRSPTGRASPEGGDITVRLVKGGNRLVTAVLHEGEALKLLCYDHTGHRREVILENLITVPAAMAVSRDDTKIAICCGNTIRLYRVDNGVPHLTGQLLAHSKCAAYDSHRRMQQVNFSVNSMMLVAATQEYRAQYKYPVYVRMWNCREREPRLEKELTPASISLGFGDDSGLSNIFCYLDAANPEAPRAFLTAVSLQLYSAILTPTEHHRINYVSQRNENRIDVAAQAPGPGFDSHFVFKSGADTLCSIDIRNGRAQDVADLSRGNLKPDQDDMALGFPKDGLVYAFWRGANGDFVMKQVDLAGKQPSVHSGPELADAYLRIVQS